jgi:phospholipid/cholesterol/gamma-HCH transport system ATP-binding protein
VVSARIEPVPERGEAVAALDAAAWAWGGEEVLHGVSLVLPRGGLVALCGPAGAGKSMLLRLLLGLARPTAGSVRLFGHEAASADGRAARAARVGVVWPTGALFEDLDVAGNVGFALGEVRRRPPSEVERAVRESLLLVGLKHVEHLRVGELAAGVRRRVALARAIVHRPELLLLDEPAGGLDPVAAEAMRELIVQLRERLGLAVLATTREPAWAFRVAEQVAILHGGQIVAWGTPAEVRASPDAAVQQLVAGRAHGPIEP